MRNLKLFLLILLGGTFFHARQIAAAQGAESQHPLPPIPTEAFRPSNARTSDGAFIPVTQFFPATRCQTCHTDTHAAWSQSLHRNAAREPFYRESADILLKTRGIEFTRHCESCHTPVALFSGALTKDAPKQTAPFTPLDDEGINCAVCHSITDARLDGTGSYTIRRPALLAAADGTPVYEINQQPITDEQILADIPGHKRAVMRPLLKSPEFCATCHKVDAPPDLNGYKHIRGFSAYDEWQQSGASHEALLTFYRREQRSDCRACHMPKVESRRDRAAKQGQIASHRWLGANTAAPLFYGQREQADQTQAFLQKNVLEMDLFALRRNGAREPLVLQENQGVSLPPGEEVTVEVVVSNRNAAHSFPPEVRDLYEAWVEFEALDAQGNTIFHSGALQPNGNLDERAHVYKQVILDEQGRPITRHQIWTTNIKAYDNSIGPGRSDVVRYRFRLPAAAPADTALTLRARVNYRRVNQEYATYIGQRQRRPVTVPVVRMTEATLHVPASAAAPLRRTGQVLPVWQRWNDYGIGLLEQAQFGAAAEAFRQAATANPSDPNLLVNAALAEMRTERFGPEREQYQKAAHLLEAALQLTPTHERARYYRALVWRSEGRGREAALELEALGTAWPRDREVQRQWAQTLYSLGEGKRARTLFEKILQIDPTDFLAWQFLAPLYAGEGRRAEAEQAQQKYGQWRDDPQAEGIAARFFLRRPEWADERSGAHVHDQHAACRPILTGSHAAPVQ
jgi:tetratricopeptide (TPR) repeat protein